MKYVVHHRYRGPGISGDHMNVPYGSDCETIGNIIITTDGRGICFTTSDVAKQYFVINNDGLGLERGALTYAIAYSRRERNWLDGSVHRFSEAEVEMLERSWSHWLRQDVGTILFNEEFFRADPAELGELAKALNIKVRR